MRTQNAQWSFYAALTFFVISLCLCALWLAAERRARTGFENGWIAYFLTDLGAPQCHVSSPFLRPDAPRAGVFVPPIDER